MLNLDKVKYLAKTTYPARKSGIPLLSITGSGTAVLNTAFGNTFLKNYKGSSIHLQLVFVNKAYYLLISKKKRPSFYTLVKSSSCNSYSAKIKSFIEILGKKGLTMRYSVEKEETNDSTIIAFKLKNVAEDMFHAKEDKSFETH